MKNRSWPIVPILALSLSIAWADETALDRADELARQREYQKALSILRRYDKSHPDDVEAHDRIQRILKRQNTQQGARAEYKYRFERDPTPFNRYLYARMLDSPVERDAKFREMISEHPKVVWGYLGLANALMDQDRLQDGIDAANDGARNVTEPAELYLVQAMIYRLMQDYPNTAAAGREYGRLKPNEHTRFLALSFEWMEVDHSREPEEKLGLADAWVEKYRKELETAKGLRGAWFLTDVSLIYAGLEQQPARVRRFAQLGLRALSAERPPNSGERRDSHFRAKGALLALQAWAEARLGGMSRVPSLLKKAQEAGPGSEMYYFSALALKVVNRIPDASRSALKAAAYPPVFAGAKELAASLWREDGGDDSGFEQALRRQREEFVPQRQKRVLSQEVTERFEPLEAGAPDGRTLTREDLAGKVTLLYLWASWCPPCRQELPQWNEFVARHRQDEGVQMLAVSDDAWETTRNFMKNHDYSFPVLRVEDYWERFSVRAIPTLLVIDPRGTLRFRTVGFEEGVGYEEMLLWQIAAVRGK